MRPIRRLFTEISVRQGRRQPSRKVSKKRAPGFGLILEIGFDLSRSVTPQKRGLLRPVPLLRAFVHWDHESRPTAPVFADVIHSSQSRQYFAVTLGLESHNRRPCPVLARIQQARASYENSSYNSFAPQTHS